jgi:hypothetical protein
MRVVGKSESDRFDELLPSVQNALQILRERLSLLGVETFIGQTHQSAADNAANLAGGKSGTGKSWHRARRAVDLYVVVDGKIDLDGKHTDRYQVLGREAVALGFRWLGTKPIKGPKGSFTDPQHLEYREGLSWEDAMAQVGEVVAPVKPAA